MKAMNRTNARTMTLVLLGACWNFGMMGCAQRGVDTEALRAEREQRTEASLAASRDVSKGLDTLEQGDHAHAVELLQRAASRNPRSAEAWTALGVALYESEKYFEASAAFDRAARLAPTRYEPMFNLGLVFEATGQYTRAIEAYEAALRLSPDQVQVMENLARTYVQANREPERALQLITRALEVEQRVEWRAWLKQHGERLDAARRAATRGGLEGVTP